MRKFSSYGPVNTRLNYYAPRTELIERACNQLIGEEQEQGGHYITVWAPRQTGKTWVMQQVAQQIKEYGDFEIAILTLQSAKKAIEVETVLQVFVDALRRRFGYDFPNITEWYQIQQLFTAEYFSKPLILIIDEFDALTEGFINDFANEFRSIYTDRITQSDVPSVEKDNLLHGLALIGVRSVLGIESVSGSPFNIQRSVHIPNLTKDEATALFHWYEEESGQAVESAVIDRLYYETRGQPGLYCWFGELLTETYNRHDSTITEHDFEISYAAGLSTLPNNNILNVISKAREEPYVNTVYEIFRTEKKTPFAYDDPHLNFLYLNGVIDWTTEDQIHYYARFASPFVQKRLFNYFSRDFVKKQVKLYDPFEDMSDTITETQLFIPQLIRRYEVYLAQYRDRLVEGAPRRAVDHRVIEAVFHFNLYAYLFQFLTDFGGRVVPEFPTGNGKIDLLLYYEDQLYGLEVKSFANQKQYKKALGQAARYGKSLGASEIWLVFFVDTISDENRKKFEKPYQDQATQLMVYPIFLVIGG